MFLRFSILFVLLITSFAVRAQTVTIYRAGSPISPTFTNIKSAVFSALDNDSLVLSADTFREKNILIDKNLSITGTFSLGVRSLIDAGASNDSSIILLINPDLSSGVVSLLLKDVECTNGYANNGFDAGGGAIYTSKATRISIEGACRLFNNYAPDSAGIFVGSRNGGAIFAEGDVYIKGTTIIDQNQAVNGGAIYAQQLLVIGDSVIIRNNRASQLGGAIYTLSKAIISDFAKLERNTAQEGGACFASGSQLLLGRRAQVLYNSAVSVGGAFSLRSVFFEMQDSSIIANNSTDTNRAAAIYNMGSSDLLLTGGQIIHNQVRPIAGALAKGVTLYNDTASGSSTVVQFNNLRIYNPQAGLGKHNEVYNDQATSAFLSDSTWWGKTDTSGLIYNVPSATVAIRSWVICDWTFNMGLPVDTQKTMPLQAYFFLHTGAALPSNMFWMLQGSFMADSGAFTPSLASMTPTNYIESNYSVPYLSKTVTLTAAVDADTFVVKPYVIGLGLKKYKWDKRITFYPNPAHNVLNLNISDVLATKLHCQITDLRGNKMMQKDISTVKGQSEIILDLNLLPGLYLLQLSADGHVLGKEKLHIQ